jgi:hypothetical protein
LAAAHGEMNAQFNLGDMYERGRGIPVACRRSARASGRMRTRRDTRANLVSDQLGRDVLRPPAMPAAITMTDPMAVSDRHITPRSGEFGIRVGQSASPRTSPWQGAASAQSRWFN